MADWDSTDLLARVKRYANRPSTDESMDDPDWYAFLTEAEYKWKPILAAHLPGDMYGAPTKLTTSDGGATYDFGERPLGQVEVYSGPNGNLLTPGFYGDPGADYVIEGESIRMVRGRERTFSDGPYARWVSPPAAIDANTDSTILPAPHRIVLVFDALERWAVRSSEKDPALFTQRLQAALFGDPAVPGDAGILGAAKTQHFAAGMAAYAQGRPYRWWRPGDQ